MNTSTQKAIPKKILSVFLTLCILLTLIPLTEYKASAEGATIGKLDTNSRSGYGWTWDGAGTLKLYGASISATTVTASGANIAVDFTEYNDDVTIDMIGYNKLSLVDNGSNTYGFGSKNNITVTGTGILDIIANESVYGHNVFYIEGDSTLSTIKLEGGYIKSESSLNLTNAFDVVLSDCLIDAPNSAIGVSSSYEQQKGYVNVKELYSDGSVACEGGYLQTHNITTKANGTALTDCVVKVTGTPNIAGIIILSNSVLITSNYATDSSQIDMTIKREPIKADGDKVGNDETATGMVYCNEAIFDNSAVDGTKSGVYYYNASTGAEVTGTLTGGNYFACKSNDAVTLGAGASVNTYEDTGIVHYPTIVGYSSDRQGINSKSTGITENSTLIGISDGNSADAGSNRGVNIKNNTTPITIIGINTKAEKPAGVNNEVVYDGVLLNNCSKVKTVIGVSKLGYGVNFDTSTMETDGAITGSSNSDYGVYIEQFSGTLELGSCSISAYSNKSNAIKINEDYYKLGQGFKLGAYAETNVSYALISGSGNTPSVAEKVYIYGSNAPGEKFESAIVKKASPYTFISVNESPRKCVYIGDALPSLVCDDELTLYNLTGSEAVLTGTCNSNINDDTDSVVFCDENGNEVTAPDEIDIDSIEVTDDTIKATLKMNGIITPVSEEHVYYLKMASNGIETSPVKLTVKEVDYCLDFTREAGAWSHAGVTFKGQSEATETDSWKWYPVETEDYGANTLVLDNFNFVTTAQMHGIAIELPGGSTVVLKGENNITSLESAIYSEGSYKIISGQDSGKPTLNVTNTKPYYEYKSLLYADEDNGTIEINDCTVTVDAIDAIDRDDPPGTSNGSFDVDSSTYGVFANKLILNNTNLTVTAGSKRNYGKSRAIMVGTLQITGDTIIHAKSAEGTAIDVTASLISADPTTYSNCTLSLENYKATTGSAELHQVNADEYLVIETNGLKFNAEKLADDGLTFTDDNILTEDPIEKGASFTFDIKEYVIGGKKDYSYNTGDLPGWLSLSDGVISGTPNADISATTDIAISVTDEMSDSIEATLIIGKVSDFFTVTVTHNEHGTVTAEPDKEKYAEGSDVTLTVVPEEGYRIKSAKLGVNDAILTPNGQCIIESIDKDYIFDVVFEAIPQYTVTVIKNEGGTVTPTTTVEEGKSFTLIVTANPGFKVDTVKLDGAKILLTDGKYTLTNITAKHTFDVTFKSTAQYQITLKCSVGGKVTTGSLTVDHGDSRTLTVSANTGYKIKSVKLDGTDVILTDGKYTIKNITTNHTFAVEFEKITYTVALSCNAGGKINHTGYTVEYGEDFEITVTPYTGYKVKSVKIDGVEVTITADGKYTVENVITADRTIAVEFEKITYTVTVHCGANGTITPETTNVEYGESITFTVKANSGYVVESVALNGIVVSLSRGKYTIESVKNNHTFAATFKKETGGTGGSGGYTPPSADKSEPTIKDKDDIEGWDKINIAINEVIKNTSLGNVVEVNMNGTTLLPKDTIELIKGKNISLVLYMSSGYSWTINGINVTAAKSLYLGINPEPDMTNVQPINTDLLNLDGKKYISIENSGDFGFTATLSVMLGKEYAGKKASVFVCGKPDFMTGATIAEDGTAQFTIANSALLEVRIDSITYMLNDATNDFKVNMQDALDILKYSVGSIHYDAKKLALLDINGDGTVNIKDALAVMKISLA